MRAMALLLPSPSSSSSLNLFNPYSPRTQISLRFPIRSNRGKHCTHSSVNIQYHVTTCRSTRIKESPPANSESLIREPHKYFDQVVITVRSGDGGHGAVLSMPDQRKASKSQGRHEEKTKRKGSYKRESDGSLILPMGGHGGDIVIYADESKEFLLEFHKKRRYNAKRGGNVDAMGTLTSHLHDGFAAPTLRIPVPVGTLHIPVQRNVSGVGLYQVTRSLDDFQEANFEASFNPSNSSSLAAVPRSSVVLPSCSGRNSLGDGSRYAKTYFRRRWRGSGLRSIDVVRGLTVVSPLNMIA